MARNGLEHLLCTVSSGGSQVPLSWIIYEHSTYRVLSQWMILYYVNQGM